MPDGDRLNESNTTTEKKAVSLKTEMQNIQVQESQKEIIATIQL